MLVESSIIELKLHAQCFGCNSCSMLLLVGYFCFFLMQGLIEFGVEAYGLYEGQPILYEDPFCYY